MPASRKTRKGQRKVENLELVWIPMSDGRRLAARIVIPSSADKHPVPAILEYIPYRRRDGTRARDEGTLVWFAQNGYAYARVDIAGSGDSDGLVEDEYVKREQDDGVEVIAWLAAQTWCSGNVGMIGISWGGFNGLQIAARRPPALKAVISLCATVDRYHDDVHFMGGCLLGDTMDWGCAFFTYAALPPDPQMAGARRWRKVWRERIDDVELFPAAWMHHQRRDQFWRHGSVIENYDAIEAPVLSVSGWSDGYTAAVFRLVENLKAPVKGLVGPWGHKYPNQGVPGPAIGFLTECKTWWDKWLKGEDNGADRLPDMRLFLQDSFAPQAHMDEKPGRWIGIPSWPTNKIRHDKFFLNTDGLGKQRAKPSKLTICSPLTTGVCGGEWCAYALGKVAPELPLDQREDDAGSLIFDTPVLKKPLRIVGRPALSLSLSCDKPQAFVCARLCDVRPDGSVARITYGLLNLTHRDSHAKPRRLKPGETYQVSVELKEAAQTVPAGHRLRVALSTSYWPMVWPSPELANLTLETAKSTFDLPVIASEAGFQAVKFAPVEPTEALKVTIVEPDADERALYRDIESQRADFISNRDDGCVLIDDIGTRVAYTKQKTFSIEGQDPCSATAQVTTTMHYTRDDWDARLETQVKMSCDRKNFYFTASLRAFDKSKTFAQRQWKKTIARDHL